MRFLRLLGWALVAAPAASVAQPLNPPVPFVASPAESSGATSRTYLAARQAQQMGLPTIAAALYRQELAQPGSDRQSLTLDLATALLDEGQPEEALRELFGLSSGHTPVWHLRVAMAQADLKRFDLAAHELEPVKLGDLPVDDRAWLLFLQGRLAAAAPDADRARALNLYSQAERAAGTDLTRARFRLAEEQERLQMGNVTEEGARQMQLNAARYQGSETGYEFERQYAVMLNSLGRKSEAIAALRVDLLALPAQQKEWGDDFRLLLGLVAGASDAEGRTALTQLLESGSDPDRRLVALQLLGTASERGPARAQFRAELDKLLAGDSPIQADLHFFRAEWALADGDETTAIDDARAILDRFPGSPLKGDALAVLTTASWDQHRYLAAADYARQAREASLPGEVRARLGVLVAEAYFRAGQEGGDREDFREAAAAYAAALNGPPGGSTGALMFQRVEAEILAGSLDRAQVVLDELEHNPGFDLNSRWEAEWNLARALQLQGQVEIALRRINAVLEAPGPAVNSELRARMEWLQAQVSFDAGQYEQTLSLAGALIGNLGRLEPAPWKTEIAGNAQLLRVQAYFSLGREEAARAALSQLRADARGSPADVESYRIEADNYAKHGQIVVALQTLRKLADQFPRSDEAPYALLQSAYLAEHLGQEKNLDQANALLKELINNYPKSEWVPDAYLKEGEVLRESNRFPEAQSTYEHLINFLPNNPDVIQAKLALADCHRAQAGLSPDSTHLESARSLYEEILDRASAEADIRVEAGYKLGLILKERSAEDAAKVWFVYVVNAFLLSPNPPDLGSRGDYWMTQTLLSLGTLYQEQGKLDEARTVWRLIIEHRLPGAQHLAQAYLDALAAGSPKP